MSDFVEVKTAELTGAALDWAVARATGADELKITDSGSVSCIYEMSCGSGCWTGHYEPSTDWGYGGLLVEKHRVDLIWEREGLIAAYLSDEDGYPQSTDIYGPTHLIAACRAIVAHKLGDTVSVPKEFLS